MASIYELKNEFDQLWMILEEELVDDDALIGAFETAQEDLAIKLENCCKYIKNQESDIAGLKEEEKRINAKRKAKENAVERLKKLMQDALTAAEIKKLPCGTFTCSIQANPKKVIVDEQYIENIPEEYLKYSEPEIDKKKIKEHLEAGIDLNGIAHLEQTEGLRIR